MNKTAGKTATKEKMSKRMNKQGAVKTRQLEIADDRWNQLFGLPEGTRTKRKVVKMTPRLERIANEMEHLCRQDGAPFPVTKANIDEVIAQESRNGEIFIGLVGIDSGQLIIADPAYLKSWKSFDKGDGDLEGWSKDLAEGDYAKVMDITQDLEAGQVPKPVLHGFAVASATNGDGSMPVFATFVNGRVRSLRIELL